MSKFKKMPPTHQEVVNANVYSTIFGHAGIKKWSPFLDLVARSHTFGHLKKKLAKLLTFGYKNV